MIFINVLLFTFCLYLYNLYSDNQKMLLDKLENISYDSYLDKKKKEKEEIINKIENNIDEDIDINSNFIEIKSSLDNKYEDLVVINNDLINKKEQLVKQKNSLQKTYNEILEEERKKSTFVINNVPKINQYSKGYPTGCESAALTSLLKYYGVAISISDVVNNLAKGSLPYYENNVRYGGNPYLEFVGHPSTYNSYGVYEKPIIDVANKFKSGIIDARGTSLNGLLNIVKQDRPVLVWVSMNMAVPYISTSWIYKPTNEQISWMANEHALLIVGYTDSQIIVADSLTGSYRYYSKSVFENRYNTFGKRALYY